MSKRQSLRSRTGNSNDTAAGGLLKFQTIGTKGLCVIATRSLTIGEQIAEFDWNYKDDSQYICLCNNFDRKRLITETFRSTTNMRVVRILSSVLELYFRVSESPALYWVNELYTPPTKLISEGHKGDWDMAYSLIDDVTEENFLPLRRANVKRDILRRMLSILEYNSFETDDVFILHIVGSRMSHSCRPNCFVDNRRIMVASTIAEGEEITLSYLDTLFLLYPKIQRQIDLQGRWGFTCICDYCNSDQHDNDRTNLILCTVCGANVKFTRENTSNTHVCDNRTTPHVNPIPQCCRQLVEHLHRGREVRMKHLHSWFDGVVKHMSPSDTVLFEFVQSARDLYLRFVPSTSNHNWYNHRLALDSTPPKVLDRVITAESCSVQHILFRIVESIHMKIPHHFMLIDLVKTTLCWIRAMTARAKDGNLEGEPPYNVLQDIIQFHRKYPTHLPSLVVIAPNLHERLVTSLLSFSKLFG